DRFGRSSHIGHRVRARVQPLVGARQWVQPHAFSCFARPLKGPARATAHVEESLAGVELSRQVEMLGEDPLVVGVPALELPLGLRRGVSARPPARGPPPRACRGAASATPTPCPPCPPCPRGTAARATAPSGTLPTSSSSPSTD